MAKDHNPLTAEIWRQTVQKIRARTPARIFVDRGPAYTTQMELELRQAHAAAVDAVWAEFDLEGDFPASFTAEWDLFEVWTRTSSKSEFLLRPDLGRHLSDSAKDHIRTRCPRAPDLQIVIGDGLSCAALIRQVPLLFPLLQQQGRRRGWKIGQSFVVHYCRVGIMNEIGGLLAPRVLILLIGERPGLATAESLSAYMAYQPHPGHTDADRNLISNIHAQGVHAEHAANLVLDLAARMMAFQLSGTTLKASEQMPNDDQPLIT